MRRRKKQQVEGLTETQKLAAITWAAEQRGESYGRFSSHLEMEDKERIFSMYQELLIERELVAKQRLETYRQKNRRHRPQQKSE